MTIESENNEIDYSIKDQQMPEEASETPRLFKRLITLCRCSLWLVILGCIFMDVRDYYFIGRQGLLWGIVFPTLIFGEWYIFAFRSKKSWARKLFIVTLFFGVGCLSCFGAGYETPLTRVFFMLSNMINLYCLILLFDNEVKAVFLPDSKATGAQATVNRYQVTFYLIFFYCVVFDCRGNWGVSNKFIDTMV